MRLKLLFLTGVLAGVILTLATGIALLSPQGAEAGPVGFGIPCFAGSPLCTHVLDSGDGIVIKNVRADRFSEAIGIGSVCPQGGRTDILPTIVLGTTQSQWTSLTEGDRTAFVLASATPVGIQGMLFGRLQVSDTEVMTPDSVFPRQLQNATWRCGSSGSVTMPTGTPTATSTSTPTGPLTIEEVKSWCNNCAGTFTLIDGGTAVKYRDPPSGCPPGFQIPSGIEYQLWVFPGQALNDDNARLAERVCEGTFRRHL